MARVLASIRAKLFLIILLAVLPALALLLYSGLEARDQGLARAEREALRSSAFLLNQQVQVTARIRELLLTLAHTSMVQELDLPGCASTFSRLRERNPIYAKILLVDLNGNVLVPSPQTSPVPNVAHRFYFKNAVATLQFTPGECVLGPTRRHILPFSYPVLDRLGRPKAVLVAGLDLENFSASLDTKKLLPGSSLSIVDQDGILLVHHPVAEADHAVGLPLKAEELALVSSPREQGTTTRNRDGKAILFAFSKMRYQPDPSRFLTVIVRTPKGPILAAADALMRRNILILLATTFLALAVAYVMGDRTMVRPLRQMLAATKQFGSGDNSVRIRLDSKHDEIGALAQAFDDMAETVARREGELRESEERFRGIFENVCDAMFIGDVEGRLLAVNGVACKRLGYTEAELLSMRVSDLDANNGDERVHEIIENLPDDRAVIFEVVLQAKDGTRIPAEISCRAMIYDGQRAFMSLARDITDKKNLEKMREDIDYIIQHDLKAPLNGLINLPQIMKNDPNLTLEQVELLQCIEDSGRNMLRMIEMSLGIMNMERGKYQCTPYPFDILNTVRNVTQELCDLAQRREIRMDILAQGDQATDSSTFAVKGEEHLCYMMLTNLITNAIEASPEGERITISVSEDAGDGLVSIHNTGMVPPEIRGRFFEKYITSGRFAGTGLGTYIASLFARVQGGSISLDTSEEGATTVVVRLPRR